MWDIYNKYKDRLIAECKWAITRLMLEYENRDFEDVEQDNIILLIKNINRLLEKLCDYDGYMGGCSRSIIEHYEKLRLLLNEYGYNNQNILLNEHPEIRISDGTIIALDRLFHLDIGVFGLEDFLD